ncbi:hypothetical protein B9L19_13520 [Geobacillus thermocatenulatus]|uniref:Uncharacterized protein n=1 Tax=Geobacillus thermocatenulatus TaxID=33938 RepID=A0A226Q4V8_9BACL|nr:hypothetical protein GT3921_14645 [Geobacillus thermocatenulatus]KLR72323.1 hypothetical protein ABH20_16950 [Geobacillus sp. T6]KPC97272.1 hypothetical protein LR69_04524 [Geobacillus sp. BCO2]OXB86542.1 hypothetical protein B9L19_13520 [Geobacillus thermocatenulatus]
MTQRERVHRRSLRRAPAAQAGPAAEQAQDCHHFWVMERYRHSVGCESIMHPLKRRGCFLFSKGAF